MWHWEPKSAASRPTQLSSGTRKTITATITTPTTSSSLEILRRKTSAPLSVLAAKWLLEADDWNQPAVSSTTLAHQKRNQRARLRVAGGGGRHWLAWRGRRVLGRERGSLRLLWVASRQTGAPSELLALYESVLFRVRSQVSLLRLWLLARGGWFVLTLQVHSLGRPPDSCG